MAHNRIDPACFLFISLALLTVGCANPLAKGSDTPTTTNWEIHLGSIPERYSQYLVVVQTYSLLDDNQEENYDSFELGQVTPAGSLRKTMAVNRSAHYLSVYLLADGSNPTYFASWDLTKVPGRRLGAGYWLDYNDYFSSDQTITFGLSSDYLQDMAQESDVALDFSDRPFYVFKTPKASGKTYRFRYHDRKGASVTVEYASSWGRACTGFTQALAADRDFTIPSTDTGVLVVRPVSYAGDTRPEATYLVHDATDDLATESARRFPVGQVMSVDGGKTLFLTEFEYWTSGTNNVLRRWVVGEQAPSVAATFPDRIMVMVASGTDLYLGVGKSVYLFRPETGQSKLLWNFGGIVLSLATLGTTHLLVNDSSGYWSNCSLVRISDFTILDTKTLVAPSRENVWIPEQNRLYRYRSGTPNDICYLEVDLATGKLGTYGDSPYHGDYDIGGKLVRLGTQNALLTGPGTVFRVDADTTSKIGFWTSLDTGFAGILNGDSHLTVLEPITVNGEITGSRVRTLNPTPPFEPLATKVQWPGEQPVELLATESGAVAVTRTDQWVVSLHLLADAAAAPSSSYHPLRHLAPSARYISAH